MKQDQDFIDLNDMIRIRRQLHQYPELGYTLPGTLKLVKKELQAVGVPFTERYGKSSLVAFINEDKSDYSIGLRADMDALPIQETNAVPYKSQHAGLMHACGHDAHTAILLGTVKALKAIEKQINCRVVCIFQANEEGQASEGGGSGARLMMNDGVDELFDVIAACHMDNKIDSGEAAVIHGATFASSDTFRLSFYGKAGHAAAPHAAIDAIAMGVKAYTALETMVSREIDPLVSRVLSVGVFQAGKASNILADHCLLEGTIRTHDNQVSAYIKQRMEALCASIADYCHGRFEITYGAGLPVVISDPTLADRMFQSAVTAGVKAFYRDRPLMYGEDFAHYLEKRKGVYFFLGGRNIARNIVSMTHNNDFDVDESALLYGARIMRQFVCDLAADPVR